MADFKSGARKSAVPNRAPVTNMQIVANAVSDADIETAANYFSALKPRKNIKVIETNSVPQTYERGWHLAKINNGEDEPIGKCIIEIPETLYDFVERSRYEVCKDDERGRYSKAVFDLLHSKYPDNLWTAKTKYWYN